MLNACIYILINGCLYKSLLNVNISFMFELEILFILNLFLVSV